MIRAELILGNVDVIGMYMEDDLREIFSSSSLEKVIVLAPAFMRSRHGIIGADDGLRQTLPITLNHLSLSYLSMSSCDGLQLEFHSLKHLELRGCENADTILNSYHHPTLVSFLMESGCSFLEGKDRNTIPLAIRFSGTL